jgi:hypothetical protein
MIGMNQAFKKVLITAAVDLGVELARLVGMKIVALATEKQQTKTTVNSVNETI